MAEEYKMSEFQISYFEWNLTQKSTDCIILVSMKFLKR